MKRITGSTLILIGLFILFKMVRVSSFGFYSMGRVNTSSIVLSLLIVSVINLFIKRNEYTWGFFTTSLVLLVLSLILGTHLYFAYVSLTDIILAFIPITAGTGLILKANIETFKRTKKEND